LYRLPGRERVRREGSTAAWSSYIGPAVDEQEVTAAGGAGKETTEKS
jgi:hypothetical protein